MKNILEHSAVQNLLQNAAAPDPTITNWLSRLSLLGDVPFQNLVADERLLPQNALRFFYIDPSWICALLDGALSIGTNTTLEEKVNSILAHSVRDKAMIGANKLRANALGIAHAMNAADPAPFTLVAGMLLRSQLVSGFPGLKIIPTYAAGQQQVPLRYETIGDGLLLVIFPAIPVSIKIQQPPQGLRFGFSDAGGSYKIKLRNITGDDTGGQVVRDGKPVEGNITATQLFRTDASADKKYVLNVETLKAAVQQSLVNAGAYPTPATPITPAQFAMQIVSTPDEANFTNPQL
ncbi:hypothetical protein BC343_27795 [Mucilaginibacter pedocola]|uniref:Uncharacterized protein n=2 Tax=Mucilaginibacter pedocola TaxID=1792845 RepID=A0A1S9PHD2_9SPHI|nr:hypothetical protein BC343_27795 [Mucilaginibacter pedocola]